MLVWPTSPAHKGQKCRRVHRHGAGPHPTHRTRFIPHSITSAHTLRCLQFVACASSAAPLVCAIPRVICYSAYGAIRSMITRSIARVLAWVTAERPVRMNEFEPKPMNNTVKIGLSENDHEMIKHNRSHDTRKSRTSIKWERDRQGGTDER